MALKVADEIVFTAKTQSQDLIEAARIEAAEIRNNSRTAGALAYKEVIAKASDNGAKILKEMQESATIDARKVLEVAAPEKEGAVSDVVSEIVRTLCR